MGMNETQNAVWVKRYRLFLYVLLISVLLFAGSLYYFLMEETKEVQDGILVQKAVLYENT